MSTNTLNTTNTNLIPFTHAQFGQVRVIRDEETGEPWFVAKDVCMVLEIQDHHQALERLEDDELSRCIVPTQVGNRSAKCVSEYGLYSLILLSRKPEARAFKRWITHEVLPAIRKHGGYLTPAKAAEALMNPEVLRELANNLTKEREAREAAEAARTLAETKLSKTSAALEEAAPKARVLDAAFARRSMEAMKVSEIARKLDGCNAQRHKRDLMELGYLYRRGQQYRVYSQYRGEDKLFIEKEDPFYFKHEIYATQKGAELIVRLFNDGQLTMKKRDF